MLVNIFNNLELGRRVESEAKVHHAGCDQHPI